MNHGIDLRRGAALVDFGRGFYTTSVPKQARNWANDRVRRGGAGPASVIRLEVGRADLATLDHLVFGWESPDFWDVIAYSRVGLSPLHAKPAPFDVVYGPVSLWPQKLVIKDCDQVSFHTRKALGVLSKAAISAEPPGNPYYVV